MDPIQQVENRILPATAGRNSPAKAATLAERMAFYKVPGVSIAVFDEYQLVWARGYGRREAGRGEPVDTATLFQAASISKTITALIVMRLVEAGRLDLDEDVNNYLTSWQVPANAGWQPRLTLRQLLSHSAGLTVPGFPGYYRQHELPTLTQILKGEEPANTAPVRVNAVPGVQFRYSGGGTTIVQQLLGDVTGQRFPELARELVLGPLGMDQSGFEQPLPRERWDRAATGHRAGGQPVAGRWHVYPEMAAAGLWTTPTELARMALDLQKTKAGRSGDILTRESVTQMLTPQVEDDIDPGFFLDAFTKDMVQPLLRGRRQQIGLGFFLEGEGRARRFGHGGSNEGFRCILTASVDLGVGAVVMTNADSGWALIEEILRAIAAVYGWPGYQRAEYPPINVETRDLDVYVGEYELRPDRRFAVLQSRGRLYLQPAGQAPLELFPLSETEFFMTAVEAQVAFTVSSTDEVKRLILKQRDQEFVAKKVS